MKERPIIFSGPMVRAILEGRKTQTRRVVKPQPPLPVKEIIKSKGTLQWVDTSGHFHIGNGKCPYGQPGDYLWLRETWKVQSESNHTPDGISGVKTIYVGYRAGALAGYGQQRVTFDVPGDNRLSERAWGKRCGWRPSIHMSRWASRITLEVVSVRVERLQDISEEDAAAELGLEEIATGVWTGLDGKWPDTRDPLADFCELWDTIAKPGARWADNPCVWVVEFKRAASE